MPPAPVRRPQSWVQAQGRALAACIYMQPVPKARARVRGGQGGYTPARAAAAEALLAGYFQQCRGMFRAGPVEVMFVLRVARFRGDGDNHEKIILDALQQAGVYSNDSQVRAARWVMEDTTLEDEGYHVHVRAYDPHRAPL